MTMFEGIIDGSQAARPAPMAELTVGAFAMEVRATGMSLGPWVGRPVAVLAICRRTLMVAGVHVAQTGVSYDSVMRCLAAAFLPRDAAEFGAEGCWPCEGVADCVFVHARHDLTPAPFGRFRRALGIEVLRHEDPEPLVGDLADRWSQETGIDVDPREDGRAAIANMIADRMPEGDEIPLDDIERRLRRWIVDRYNAVPVPGIEHSPIEMWREAAVGFVPRFVPADAPGDLFRADRFRMIGLRGVTWPKPPGGCAATKGARPGGETSRTGRIAARVVTLGGSLLDVGTTSQDGRFSLLQPPSTVARM